MVKPGAQYVKWRRRCWGLALLLLSASLAPMVYCMIWAQTPADMEAASLGYCVGAHPLQFPTTIFVVGVMMIIAAIVLRQQQLQAEQDEEDLQRRVDRAASRQQMRTPSMNREAMQGRGPEVPDEIEVGDDVQFGDEDDDDRAVEDSNSVMSFLQEQQEYRPIRRDPSGGQDSGPIAYDQSDVYVPPGMENAPVVYLDASVDPLSVADPSRRVNNSDLPYADAGDALRHAFELVMERQSEVVVRVMPGVYQSAIEVPDRVTIINHRMPLGATVDERLAWLREQEDVDHEERVTFLAPEKSKFGARVMPGNKQGIFGCYFVGRPGIAQTGLQCRDNVALAVVHCGFEAFSGGGGVVIECGEDLPGRRAQFVGCLWRHNAAPKRGGALFIESGAVRVEASIFDGNRAPRGGAIAVVDTDKPLIVERSLLQRNRALANGTSPAVDEMKLQTWRTTKGIGGALVVRNGLVKLQDTIFDGNDAVVGGGAIAALASRVVVKSTGPERGSCRENRADAGGALLAVGWAREPAMIRAKGAEIVNNLAKTTGGGAAAVGNAILHFEDAKVDNNRAAGGERGVGGGIAVWRGGGVQILAGIVTGNKADAGGGGVAALNGSLKIDDGATVNRNRALGGAGGGVMVATVADTDLDRIMGQPGFSLPFKIKIENARITANVAAGPGGGLAAGSLYDDGTFPMALLVRRASWITENKSRDERNLAQNIWIQWAQKVEANDDSRGVIKLSLQAVGSAGSH